MPERPREQDHGVAERHQGAPIIPPQEICGCIAPGQTPATAPGCDHLAGKDSLLLARTTEQARELARRVRDDLIHYGLVDDGTVVSLREGVEASSGDLITARRNNRQVAAGAPGRWLTNGDVLRIEAIAD